MTKEEDILHALRRLEAMSRRKPHEHLPHENGEAGQMPPGPPRNQGRGRMLATLHDCGPMSQSQLACRLDIRPQSLSELLGKAEAEGLIERRQSEEDKRQTIVSITEAGHERVAGFRETHRRRAQAFCAPLTEEEKSTLIVLLEKLLLDKEEAKTEDKEQEV